MKNTFIKVELFIFKKLYKKFIQLLLVNPIKVNIYKYIYI